MSMMNELRKNGTEVLSTVLTVEKNIDILEKYAYEAASGNEELYRRILLQIVGDVLSGLQPKECLDSIKNQKIGWSHSMYETAAAVLAEQDDFIQHPFQVEEGVLECKCGSRKVYSFSKQTRSADEPMTTYAECVTCGSKWTYSG